MIDRECDIVIVGGGLIGATLMLALRGSGYSSLLVDAEVSDNKINPDFDARSLALSPASKRILTMLGVWDYVQEHATPINLIHVSQQFQFGVARLEGTINDPLGYVVEMQHINRAIHQISDPQQILAPAKVHAMDELTQTLTIATDSGEKTIRARLIVAADGAHSTVRQLCNLPAHTKLYGQQAIVANIGLVKDHNGCAYERFTADGPLALLPMQKNRMSLVWATSPDTAEQLMSLSDAEFLSKLQQAFGSRLGRFAKTGKRFHYPLQQIVMPRQIKNSMVFVGNAAHTLHPVAGQGFNLGLRDVATLAQCIVEQGLDTEMLQRYVQLRAQDQKMITCLTDGLISVFTSSYPGISLARGLGLVAVDNSSALKNLLARYASGFGGFLPDLVCDIALINK